MGSAASQPELEYGEILSIVLGCFFFTAGVGFAAYVYTSAPAIAQCFRELLCGPPGGGYHQSSSSEIASSLPLQMLVYFNFFFSILFAFFHPYLHDDKFGCTADGCTTGVWSKHVWSNTTTRYVHPLFYYLWL